MEYPSYKGSIRLRRSLTVAARATGAKVIHIFTRHPRIYPTARVPRPLVPPWVSLHIIGEAVR